MKQSVKEQRRSLWMQAFERELQKVCEARSAAYPHGNIEWASPTYHFLNGNTATEAAVSYFEAYGEQ
jgi:hypothetical protein